MDYSLGIDIGSTTVKVAVIDSAHKVLFSDYQRHFANIKETLQELFPDRQVIQIYARDILIGGGNIHCITQQIPANI